ncbi:MAG TPA: hypothetical protein VFQ54_11315, partial [Thermomicrobiales bacterium]|nr:hypothetical protein [Thermomicrobiales bacterium]
STSIPVTTVPTGTVAAAGDVILTLSTGDGGSVPPGTKVCIADRCQTVGAEISGAAVSDATLRFATLAPGTYPLAITNAAPYQDATGNVTIADGQTTAVDIVLERAAATTPTEPGAATPIVTRAATIAPTREPGGGAAVSPGQKAPSGNGQVVTSLPNTGSGAQSPTASVALLVLAMAAILGACVLNWRRRRI